MESPSAADGAPTMRRKETGTLRRKDGGEALTIDKAVDHLRSLQGALEAEGKVDVHHTSWLACLHGALKSEVRHASRP